MLVATVDASALELEDPLVYYPMLVRLPPSATVLGRPTSVELEGVSLPFEVGGAESQTTFYVELPRLAPSDVLTLRFGFGDTVGDTFASQVWSDTFRGVWHFDDALTGGELANAAVPDDVGRLSGGVGPENSVPGVVGGAIRFDGIDDIATFNSGFLGQLEAFSLTMWARIDVPDDGAPRIPYFESLNGDGLYPRCWRAEDLRVQCQLRSDASDDAITVGADGPRTGRFAHLALVLDAASETLLLYIDGVLVSEASAPGVPQGGSEPLELAHGQWGFSPITVDELRISDMALSPSWLRADVRTQGEQSGALLQFADVELNACSP